MTACPCCSSESLGHALPESREDYDQPKLGAVYLVQWARFAASLLIFGLCHCHVVCKNKNMLVSVLLVETLWTPDALQLQTVDLPQFSCTCSGTEGWTAIVVCVNLCWKHLSSQAHLHAPSIKIPWCYCCEMGVTDTHSWSVCMSRILGATWSSESIMDLIKEGWLSDGDMTAETNHPTSCKQTRQVETIPGQALQQF